MFSKIIVRVALIVSLLALSLFAVHGTFAQENSEAHILSGLKIVPDGEVGFLIAGVMPHSPAAIAGLTVGDVILAIDNNFIEAKNFDHILGTYQAGDTIPLTVVRDGEVIESSLTLDESSLTRDTTGSQPTIDQPESIFEWDIFDDVLTLPEALQNTDGDFAAPSDNFTFDGEALLSNLRQIFDQFEAGTLQLNPAQ